MSQLLRHSVVAGLFFALTSFTYGQTLASGPAAPSSSATAAPVPASPSPSTASSGRSENIVGIGVKGSLLGGGVEVAARVTHRTNVRAGFNMFTYSRDFHKDSISYAGQLQFKTVEAHYDFFPFAGKFHVSPGVLAYIGDPITANAAVPGGQSFSLGGTTYYSDTATPVTGSGKIDFNRAAPMATFGWGNLVPRNHGHFSVPVELGVAFQGSPKATLNLAGNVCTAPGVGCRPVATDATVQANILSEQTKVNNSMSVFKAYPIISVGFGYSF
ncbi:MAG TPA: hypothetical protein VKR60_07050 [Candidatus Sulfotelmatobacter sp.]|nr:hypothetical protein [Candidatus Sulfotelmatobacter sp.]